ncbi:MULTISPECIES: ECF transporter S component [Streptomyces albovinaceus subgroup]|uniref:Substrate-specific component CbrT of predicted cobalamin ECF transporter n=1 Tax=Streptomyces globisporus TaxID=1908 RepID=A0ABM9H350_STRGL|nr:MULTISPECIES: ECF transporter S component [Streptomyces albovinaceus subgroup]WSF80863.1 ECF transporter S component [Streptomyces globisporus]CAH9418031.1 Substrate-specific component CbrT of predicted cobalamin ECF transporter [Streptomyces globisporus]
MEPAPGLPAEQPRLHHPLEQRRGAEGFLELVVQRCGDGSHRVEAGRVHGPGFGFTLDSTSLFASALISGGVGPWMPYQMFGCAFVGMLAGLLPRATGRREVLMLAVYGSLSGYLFGFLLNLSFWPFSLDPNSSIAYLPGLPFTEQWQRYLAFDVATSLGWDTGRAVTNFVCVMLAGPAVLTTFRRAARKARFRAPVRFAARKPDGEGQAGIDSTTRTP